MWLDVQIPFTLLEATKLSSDPNLDINPFLFITNAMAAFGALPALPPAGPGPGRLHRQHGSSALGCRRARRASFPALWSPALSPTHPYRAPCRPLPLLPAGLNMAVFLLIGKTSALTMNIAGVVKDWMLIGLSVWMFKAAVTGLNLFGYFIAFLAVCWWVGPGSPRAFWPTGVAPGSLCAV